MARFALVLMSSLVTLAASAQTIQVSRDNKTISKFRSPGEQTAQACAIACSQQTCATADKSQ